MAALDRGRRTWRMPLSFVIARYFFYVLAALLGVWLATFTAFSMALNAGIAYPANYSAAYASDTVAAVQATDMVNEDVIPSAYRYVHVDPNGTVLATDLSGENLLRTIDATAEQRAEGAQEPQVFGLDGTTYAIGELSDGSFCILTSTYLPEYASRELRNRLPNPQNLMIAFGGAGSALAVVLIARRASSVLVRKMQPLTEAAERIGREELDFSVGESNVWQIDDVLAAMERMRGSLADSLDARWRAERAQRDQVAALAHDLKTPLTVIRANAEYVADEARELGADDTGALADIAAAAQDAADGCKQVDRYVQLLIEASRGGAPEGAKRQVTVAVLAESITQAAAPLARAAGISLAVEQDRALADARAIVDAEAIERAVVNLASNAIDHARKRVRVMFNLETNGPDSTPGTFVIMVDDDGPGFSPAALEHGCERFFRDDASRTGAASGAHYGIGLFTAAETARDHGGSLELSNRVSADGSPAGARVVVRLPLA